LTVFFDTNVLFAALATRGLCVDLLRVVLLQHRLVTSPFVLEELAAALDRKLGLPAERIAAIVSFLDDYVPATLTTESPDVAVPAIELRDPNDLAIVRGAVAAGAELLVTGDKDLLEVTLPVRVVTPRGLWEALGGGARPRADEVHEP
jgi:putative PIN family toxin of toxin-antitoxin system